MQLGEILILVGENDVGKSNLLAGIGDFLAPPRRMSAPSDHFAFDLDRAIVLEGTGVLEDNDEPGEGLQDCLVNGHLLLRRRWETGETQTSSIVIGADEEETDRTLVKEAQGLFPKLVRVPPLRDVSAETKVGPRSDFGKTLLPIIEEVSDDMQEGREELEASIRDSLGNRFEVLSGLLREINPRVEAVRPKVRMDVQKGLELELLVRDASGEMPLEAKGSGLQSAMVVALLRYYARVQEVQKYVVTVEEPEAFLYPQLQRVFFDALRALGGSGQQVSLSTHSPYFIDGMAVEELRDNVAVVRYDPDHGSKLCRPEANDLTTEDLEWIQRNVTSKNSEMLFARTVLLVEGPTERFAIPIFAERLGINCDGEGICVLDVGSNRFDAFLKLLQTYEIPQVVFCDADAKEGLEQCIVHGLVDNEDCFVLEEGDFEALYPEKIREAVRGLSKPSAGRVAAQSMDAVPEMVASAIGRALQRAQGS